MVTASIPRNTPREGLGAAIILILTVPISISRPLATHNVHTSEDGAFIASRSTIEPCLIVVFPSPRSHGTRSLPPLNLLTSSPEGSEIEPTIIPVTEEIR